MGRIAIQDVFALRCRDVFLDETASATNIAVRVLSKAAPLNVHKRLRDERSVVFVQIATHQNGFRTKARVQQVAAWRNGGNP